MERVTIKKLDVSAADSTKGEILKYAAEMRKFEIGLLWQRSLFFWGFISAAFVAYAALSKSDSEELLIAIACFGVVCSFAWTLQNRGSKYWQEAWEQKVRSVECDVLKAPLFSNIEPREENRFWGSRRYSVSNLLTALSDFTFIIWVALLLAALHPELTSIKINLVLSISTVLPLLTLAWVIAMLLRTRRTD